MLCLICHSTFHKTQTHGSTEKRNVNGNAPHSTHVPPTPTEENAHIRITTTSGGVPAMVHVFNEGEVGSASVDSGGVESFHMWEKEMKSGTIVKPAPPRLSEQNPQMGLELSYPDGILDAEKEKFKTEILTTETVETVKPKEQEMSQLTNTLTSATTWRTTGNVLLKVARTSLRLLWLTIAKTLTLLYRAALPGVRYGYDQIVKASRRHPLITLFTVAMLLLLVFQGTTVTQVILMVTVPILALGLLAHAAKKY